MSTSTETYGRGLYVGVLAVASLLSVAGNAVYAYAAPATVEPSLSPGWAAAAHMVPPVLLLLVTEVLAMASTKFDGPGRAWALAGVVVIAGAAFALSFDALYAVAEMAKVRSSLAWLVPVMLDASIIVCTILVLMASRRMQRDRAAVDMPADHVDHPADHPADQTDHLTDHGPAVSPSTGQPGPSVSYAQVTTADHGPSTEDLDAVFENLVAELDDRSCDSDTGSTDHADHPVDQTDHPADHADHPADRSTDRLAELVREELGTAVDVEVIARALELKADGASLRAIGAEVGVSHNTVGRWVSCAADLAAHDEAVADGGQPARLEVEGGR